MRGKIRFTKKGILYGLLSALLFTVGILMIGSGIRGFIDFGTGEVRLISIRIWVILAIFLISLSPVIIRNDLRGKILSFLTIFIGLIVIALIIGSFLGVLDAAGGGTFSVASPFLMFDVSMTAVADLTVGMNMKLIADSIYYMVPSVAFFVLVFQIIYSGEGDEFAKALIEGIAVCIFMWIYSTVSGMPMYL